MKTDIKKIQDRLKSDYRYVESLGYVVLGVFLQGSQNYKLDYEGSDIDTKCIILPSFENFCLNKRPISTTLILPSNEHIDLKDIRLMFECFKKQNINFIEILFTKYKLINPDFAELFNPMFTYAEQISRYNNYAFINCMAGMSMEKLKAMEHKYPTLIDKIEKFGYDPKQLHHIARINEFMHRYINGESYSDCLISKQSEFLIDIKRGKYTLDEARKMAKELMDDINNIKQQYISSHELTINKEVEILFKKVLLDVLRKSFEMDIHLNNKECVCGESI